MTALGPVAQKGLQPGLVIDKTNVIGTVGPGDKAIISSGEATAVALPRIVYKNRKAAIDIERESSALAESESACGADAPQPVRSTQNSTRKSLDKAEKRLSILFTLHASTASPCRAAKGGHKNRPIRENTRQGPRLWHGAK